MKIIWTILFVLVSGGTLVNLILDHSSIDLSLATALSSLVVCQNQKSGFGLGFSI